MYVHKSRAFAPPNCGQSTTRNTTQTHACRHKLLKPCSCINEVWVQSCIACSTMKYVITPHALERCRTCPHDTKRVVIKSSASCVAPMQLKCTCKPNVWGVPHVTMPGWSHGHGYFSVLAAGVRISTVSLTRTCVGLYFLHISKQPQRKLKIIAQ